MESKYENLLDELRSYGRVAVAFSGGVDSALLLHAAREALGDDAIAISVDSPLFPQRELEEARAFCEEHGIRHVIVSLDQLKDERFCANPPERCYICKLHLLGAVMDAAHELGFETVAEGSNLDDDVDYRPGMKAVAELGAKSPLKQAGLTKQEIRSLSREKGLPTWDKQSFACLATRFAFGDAIDKERLRMIGEAEQFLLGLGFHQVRVRVKPGEGKSSPHARIEVSSDEVSRLLAADTRGEVESRLEKIGFAHVEIDPTGYRTGNMNGRPTKT